jgi:hypothetical protein
MQHYNLPHGEYASILAASSYIEEPDIDQLFAICPHLTARDIRSVFMREGGGYIALPPLLVNGSFQVAHYYPGDDREKLKPHLAVGAYSGRTHLSCAPSTSELVAYCSDYHFVREALAYAEAHWPACLVLDNWVDFLSVYLCDPRDLIEGVFGGPSVVRRVHVGLNRDWNELNNDHSKPRHEILDGAISITTTDAFEGLEIKGDRNYFERSYCALCGGGLSLSCCTGCGREYPFTALSTPSVGCLDPLPPKLVKLFHDAGHEFERDPARLHAPAPSLH